MSNSSSQPIAGFDFPGQLPEIQVNDRQLRDLIEETWQAILASNDDPYIFQRNGKLVFVEFDGVTYHIREMNKSMMDGYLTQIARWHSKGRTGKTEIFPPVRLTRQLINSPRQEIPYLDEVTSIPSFDRDGELMIKPDYYPKECLWIGPHPDFEELVISENPIEDEVWASITFLQEAVLGHFSFKSEAEKANALALMFLPFLRKMINGPTPMHLITSSNDDNRVLAESIGLLVLGLKPFEQQLSRKEDKIKASIRTALREGYPVTVFDGPKNGCVIDSSNLSALLTAHTWCDRIPGTNTMGSYKNRAVWIMLADQPDLSQTIARRCVPIQLSASKNPNRRLTEDYLHMVKRDRGEIVKAILTIIQSWVVSGKPTSKGFQLPSFNQWSEVSRNVLESVGVNGLLENFEQFFTEATRKGVVG